MKMEKKLASLILIISFSCLIQITYGQRDSLWTVNDISNMTIYITQKNETSSPAGTGTIIRHNKKYFLLTANHVAKLMYLNPQIVFRVAEDKPAIINLIEITVNHKLNWIDHPEADISIIEILGVNENVKKRLEDWSFSSKFIYSGHQALERDNDVTFFGFPLIDLELKYFSPLSFTAYLASGLITNKRYDTKTKCTFFYLDQPSMQGCSGGGVFCSVKKNSVYMGMGKTLMIGVVHGTANDDTGGKLTAITPSFYIWDLLNKTN